MDNDILHAVSIIKNGGIVIFPTDTAFGIGCRIDNQKSVERPDRTILARCINNSIAL